MSRKCLGAPPLGKTKKVNAFMKINAKYYARYTWGWELKNFYEIFAYFSKIWEKGNPVALKNTLKSPKKKCKRFLKIRLKALTIFSTTKKAKIGKNVQPFFLYSQNHTKSSRFFLISLQWLCKNLFKCGIIFSSLQPTCLHATWPAVYPALFKDKFPTKNFFLCK